jgi:preprotein translocase subunit YajC
VNSGFFVLVILLLFLLWLMLVRPQRRRRQAQEAMIDHLRIGDEVLTAGGFFATVSRIDEDEVTVELSPGNEARVAKRAIAAVIPVEEAETGVEDDEDASGEPETTGQARR